MIQSTVGHLVFNVHPENLAFYKDMFTFAGWTTVYEDPSALGMGSGPGVTLWFGTEPNEAPYDYDGVGMNHIALSVASQQDVDAMVEYLKEHSIPALFETPRHRPEFTSDPSRTYYQVMFESPDCILFEVVYTGPIAG